MDSPDPPPSPTGWLRQCRSRFVVYWAAKAIGTTVGMTLFFVAYFWLLNHPLDTDTTMPLIFLDRLVPFQPLSLPLYLSLWFYITLPPFLLVDRGELLRYGAMVVAISLAGLVIFALWPTKVPPASVDWSLHPSFAFLKSADPGGNACPSLHVAFAVFSAFWLGRILRGLGAGRPARALNWLWGAGIVWSTMATRQHVALDVLAGVALAALAAWLHLRWLGARARTT